MAELFETDVSDYSFHVAAEDLSDKQYYIVTLNADGKVALCTAADEPYGVLINKPKAGQAAKVRIKGVSRVKVSSGANLTMGVPVGSDDSGCAIAVEDDGGMYVGKCVVPGAAGSLASITVDGGIRHTLRVA